MNTWQTLAKSLIKKHEGVRNGPYKDSLGIPTIGVGFNMSRADARNRLAQVGLKNWAPPIRLNDAQVDQLLDLDIADCASDLFVLVQGFQGLSDKRKAVLCDLRFNLGPMRFRAFRHMLDAIANKNFDEAANQMLSSVWASQVGTRATEDAEIMRNG